MDPTTHVLPSPRFPRESALHFQASGFARLIGELLDWLRFRGREVTDTGVLRPAVARRAYDDLGLGAWQQSTSEVRNRGPLPAEVLSAVLTRGRDRWRSAADCAALDRLWTPARQLGLIGVVSRRAHVPGRLPTDPDESASFAMAILLSLCLWARDRDALRPLPTVLLLLAGPTARPRTLDELGDAWHHDPANSSVDGPRWPRPTTDRELLRCLSVFGDTGLWLPCAGDILCGTELGLDFTRLLLDAIDHHFFCERQEDVRE